MRLTFIWDSVPTLFPRGFAAWTCRNQQVLLKLNLLSTFVLFLFFVLTATISILPADTFLAVLIAAFVPLGLILLSLTSKGVVPIAVAVLGVVLIHNAIILPYYSSPEKVEVVMNGHTFSWTFYTEGTVFVAGMMHFSLGVAMTLFATILGYRPSALFTCNRPPPRDDEWSRYPVWRGAGSVFADGRLEQVVPVKELMTEVDRRLLWRYESILAVIHGVPQLVMPRDRVPPDSTELLRDRASGRLLGKARYEGMFI